MRQKDTKGDPRAQWGGRSSTIHITITRGRNPEIKCGEESQTWTKIRKSVGYPLAQKTQTTTYEQWKTHSSPPQKIRDARATYPKQINFQKIRFSDNPSTQEEDNIEAINTSKSISTPDRTNITKVTALMIDIPDRTISPKAKMTQTESNKTESKTQTSTKTSALQSNDMQSQTEFTVEVNRGGRGHITLPEEARAS